MRSDVKILFVCINAAVAFIFFILHTSQAGYQTSIFTTYPPTLWLLVSGCLIGIVALAFISCQRLIIFSGMLATMTLIAIPLNTGAGVYGPDSYFTAVDISHILHTGYVNTGLYSGIQILAASGHQISPSIQPRLVVYLGVAGLSPLAFTYAGRWFGLNSGIPFRLLIAAGAYLPFGFGMWLSTRSLFHPFYLSLPLALVFITTVLQYATQPNYSRYLLALVTGLGVSFIHPMAAIFSLAAAAIIGFADALLSRNKGNFASLSNGLHPFIPHFGLLVLPFIIQIFYFQILDQLSVRFLAVLYVDGGGTSTICKSSYISPINNCGIAPSISLVYPIILFATVTGAVGVTLPERLSASLRQQHLDRSTRLVVGLYGTFVFGFGVATLGLIRRLLAYRFVGLVSILGLIALTLLVQSRSHHTRWSTFVFFAGGCAAVFIGPIAVGLTPQYVVVTSLVAGIAVVVGATISYDSRNSFIALICVLLIFALLVPAMYPFAEVNAEPNQAGTEVEHSMVEWVSAHGVQQIATDVAGYRIYRYLHPHERGYGPYAGSSWLGSEILLDGDEQQKQRITNPGSEPTEINDLTHIAITPFSRDYMPVRYTTDTDEIVYSEIRSLKSNVVKQKFPKSSRVYDGGKNTAIYHVTGYKRV